uniref:C2H2-type domain-containing protein n=1 Tax=Anopheles albimanus TaxID=7167 RepID=A0A182FGV7_ANOAL
MLGKYGDASSSSMMNLESGLRNRVLYHQNMMGMNLMAEFYHHNPTLVNAATVSSSVAGSSSSNSAIAQSQKMLNSLSGNQQSAPHSNGTPLAISSVSTAATVTSTSSSTSSSSQQPLAQFQCQVCQKTYLTSAMLAVHMKTHDAVATATAATTTTGGFVSRQETTVGSSYLQPSASSLEHVPTRAAAHGANSKTSPPLLLAQHSIKSEYAGTPRGIGSLASGQFSSPYGIIKQFDCHICHKSFMTMMNLNLHMKIHENDQKVVAAHVYSSHAGATGATYHQQQGHQQQLHPTLLQAASSSGAVPSTTASTGRNTDGVCQICHKTFNSTEQFTAHMKIHEEEFKNRALYHSSTTTGGSTAVAASAAAFYPTLPQTATSSATQSQQQQQLPTVTLYQSSKGHRCPICHKMSSNIIEHIKQHEGQLIMGGGGSSAPGTGGGSPSAVRCLCDPLVHSIAGTCAEPEQKQRKISTSTSTSISLFVPDKRTFQKPLVAIGGTAVPDVELLRLHLVRRRDEHVACVDLLLATLQPPLETTGTAALQLTGCRYPLAASQQFEAFVERSSTQGRNTLPDGIEECRFPAHRPAPLHQARVIVRVAPAHILYVVVRERKHERYLFAPAVLVHERCIEHVLARVHVDPALAPFGPNLGPHVVTGGEHVPCLVPEATAEEGETVGPLTASATSPVEAAQLATATVHLDAYPILDGALDELRLLVATHGTGHCVDPAEKLTPEPGRQFLDQQILGTRFLLGRIGALRRCTLLQQSAPLGLLFLRPSAQPLERD